MPDEPQAPDVPETPQPEQPTPPDGGEELPPEKPIDTYEGLRDDLKTQLEGQYQEKMQGFLHPEPNPQLASSAANIVSQHAIRYLPAEGEVSPEHLSQAITAAQTDLADRRLWYQAILPKEPIRIDIAKSIASRYTPEKLVGRRLTKTSNALRTAADDYRNRVEQTRVQLPKREDLLPAIQSELQKSGITDKKLYTKQAVKIASDLDKWTFSYQAAPPQEVIQTAVQRRAGKHVEDTQGLATRLSENTTVSKHYEAGAQHHHLVAHGLTKTINKAASSRLVRGARKLTKAADIIRRPLTYAGRAATFPVRFAVRKVTRPIGRVVKRGVRRVAIGAARLAAKVLVKVGLGGLVKNIERVALASTGVGIPLLIAQEAALFGIGQLFKAKKSLQESWQKAYQSRNVGEALINNIGASIDTVGAGIGGIVGGVAGTGVGAIGGAIIGSLLGPVGTIIGGVLGGVAGGLFGAGVGANAGARLRKNLKRMIAIRLFLKLLWAKIAGLIKAAAFTLGGALTGAVIGFAVGGPVGALVGGIIGGTAGYLLPKAATSARQLVYIARHYAFIEGPIAQVFKGIGNLLAKIPSGIARAFNAATGWIGGTTTSATATAEAVATGITTAGPGTALALTPVATIATVGLFAFITYSVLITAFFVPPTEVTPFFEIPSRFIKITKTACATSAGGETFCDVNGQLVLENPTAEGPYDIVYQIIVEAVDQTLTNVAIEDTYTAFGENDPTPPAPLSWNGTITIGSGDPWSETVNLTIPRSSSWDDSLLINTVTVTAFLTGTTEPIVNSNSVNIIFGNPPFCPPSGDPLATPYGWIRGFTPGFHTGVDVKGSPAIGATISSTFPCRAIVRHAGLDTYDRGQFGFYVALQSGPWFAFYSHMNATPYVNEGDIVGGGTALGPQGSSGNSSGPHLHYEIREGTSVNPKVNWQPTLAKDPCNFGVTACP
ncbi:peptidoglycan DD-metalloendopeptidase family protein [Patescibacteria group bacterium]|nr:peptidoglycan DD-metalloendopeptidase family protein [Patescibacteria group bacterium]